MFATVADVAYTISQNIKDEFQLVNKQLHNLFVQIQVDLLIAKYFTLEMKNTTLNPGFELYRKYVSNNATEITYEGLLTSLNAS